MELKYSSVSTKGIESYFKHSELLHSASISDRRKRILSSEFPGLAISITNVSPNLSKQINDISLIVSLGEQNAYSKFSTLFKDTIYSYLPTPKISSSTSSGSIRVPSVSSTLKEPPSKRNKRIGNS